MLSPRYLEGLSDEIVDIYAQLEADILQDMARRIARLGKITEASKWQAQLLAETGALKKDVNRLIKKYDPAVQKEIKAIYNDALIKNARADNRIFTEALGHGVSDINAQIMLASIQKTHSDLSRLTITTAYTSEQQFVQQANAAYMQVVTGAFDYDNAMKNACDNLAKNGISAVQYRNGKPVHFSIEAAVRMNILTGVNQTASAMTMNNCDELGCDLVETTAHIGARPEHEAWQGEVFSISGTNPKYRPFSVCELGTVTGLCGINCRHSYYPYFEGMERHYTQDDLDEMNKQTVTYNGQKMTRYEGEEKLRYIERNIRAYKRRTLTQEAGGVDSTAARVKIGEWQQRARDFTKQTGIQRDSAREFIGTIDGKQPRGIAPSKTAADTKETILNAPIEKEYHFITGKPQTITAQYDREIETMIEKATTLKDTQKIGNIIIDRAEKNGSSIYEEIAKVREMGVKDTGLRMVKGSDAGAMKTIADGLNYLPTRTGKQLIQYFEENNMRAVYGRRSQLQGHTITLNGRVSSGVHEMAHILEKTNPWLAELEKQFYNKRTAGEEEKLLAEVTGNHFYKENERCKVDHFLAPYMGKYIDGKSWELFTTGLEHIIFNKYPGTDKDFESFVIGLLLRI